MNERSVEGANHAVGSLGTLPVACAAVTAILFLNIFLITIGNITDFDTNLAFVRHVMAMDTTNFGAAPGTKLDPDVMWRAITAPAAHYAAYLGIILWEGLTAVVLLRAVALWVGGGRTRRYHAARRWSSLGMLMIAVLFLGGFIAIGGEWFQMWRSTDWNAIDAAFRNVVMALLGLVLLHLPARDWDEPMESSARGEGT
jgi:predicted small integral membrane protein